MNNINKYENIATISESNPIIFRITTSQIFATHWHEAIELFYPFNTRTKITCDDTAYEAKEGDLVIVNSNQHHSIEGKGSFMFQIDLQSFLKPYQNYDLIFKNHIRGDEAIRDIFSKILDEYESRREGFHTAIKGYAYVLMTHLIRNHQQTPTDKNAYFLTKNRTEFIKMITDYVDSNYSLPLKTSDLAKRFNISKQYLCSIFKAQTGSSVTSYINERRIKKSTVFLKNTNHSITEIASRVGYNDSNYFSRIFKQYMGMSPKQYMKLSLQKNKTSGETY